MIAIALIIVLFALLCVFGMAKWTSVIFSGGSGKLGNQIVMSKWKGRNYMRAYVIPANPNTAAQKAQRDKARNMVTRYQAEVKSIADAVTQWNELALPRQLSGFNLFGKYALKIELKPPPGGAAPYDADITYTCPVDLSEMGLYRSFNGALVTEEVAKGGLSAGVDQVYADLALAAGDYEYFIGPADVFADQAGADKNAVKCCSGWASSAAEAEIVCEFTVT